MAHAKTEVENSGNTTYTEMRCIQFPCIVGGIAVDRFGLFDVDMDANNKPIRARIIRPSGFATPEDLINFSVSVDDAIFTRPTLTLVNDPVDLDAGTWEGSLYFPRLPTLR